MIGVYDYTVVLTYLSLLSGSLGIIVCLQGVGHPYYGIFCLLFSGLCDTFDGKVARTKKNRTESQKRFGIQIDSLADLVAFGVLPGCIAISLLRVSTRFEDVPHLKVDHADKMVVYPIVLTIIVLIYILAALIRLAYFNVQEEERSAKENTVRKYYTGLPVTSAAIIFPTFMLIQFATKTDLTLLYFVLMAVVAFLFVSKLQIKKPQKKGLIIMVGLGTLEAIGLVILLIVRFNLHL